MASHQLEISLWFREKRATRRRQEHHPEKLSTCSRHKSATCDHVYGRTYWALAR